MLVIRVRISFQVEMGGFHDKWVAESDGGNDMILGCNMVVRRLVQAEMKAGMPGIILYGMLYKFLKICLSTAIL